MSATDRREELEALLWQRVTPREPGEPGRTKARKLVEDILSAADRYKEAAIGETVTRMTASQMAALGRAEAEEHRGEGGMNPVPIAEWLFALALAMVAAAVAVAVTRHFGRAARQFRRIVEEEAPRPAVGETRPGDGPSCLWCHPTRAGRAGRCGCTGKCEDVDWCIGDYTTFSGPEFAARLEAMLHEGGQHG